MPAQRLPICIDAPLLVTNAPGVAAPKRHAWVGSILAALLIALASALLPGAMPASQMVGSAFNPATTQVALSRDETEQSALAAPDEDRQRLRSSDSGTHAPAMMALPAIVLVTTALRIDAAWPSARIAPARHAFARPGAGPRAPPATA